MSKRRRKSRPSGASPPAQKQRSQRRRIPLAIPVLSVALLLIAFGVWAFYLRGGVRSFDDPVRQALDRFMEPLGEPRHRVLVVGWDGASFDMIDPLLAAGRLPNFQRVLDEGTSLELESTILPVSPEAWTAAVTGKGPAKAGIFSFFNTIPGSYGVRLISARDRRAPAIWQFLNHYELKTHVVGVPVTYPPEPIDGVMIAGMLSPFNAEYAHPPGLTDALRGLGFIPDIDAWRDTHTQRPEEIVEQQHTLKLQITTNLLAHSDWDFALIVFKCLDVLKHRMHTGATQGPIADHYVRLDAALGQLRAAAGPDTDLLVMSDHGFANYSHYLSIHGALVELGLAALAPQPTQTGAAANQPLAEQFASIHADEMNRLDMSKTRVYCALADAEANYAALRINVQGRQPTGCVPADQREAVIAEAMEKLRSLRQYPDGPPIFTRVLRFADIYQGPYQDDLPEIAVEADRMFMCRAPYEQPFIWPNTPPRPDHALIGVLAAAGPSFEHQPQRGRASVLDIAPTVLQLFSLPVSNRMDGRVLTELFRGDVQVVIVDEQELKLADHAGPAYGSDEARQVYERLEALGYVGDDRKKDGESGGREP